MAIYRFIISYFRGNIPGGPWLLLLLLGMFTFILWYVVRTSGLVEKRRARHLMLQGWLILIVAYFIIWMATKPQPLPKTLLVLPFEDQTTERWIGEALADQLGTQLVQTSVGVHLLPWEIDPQISQDLPPNSLWQKIKRVQPTFAVWGKVWGRADSLWVESYYARTRWGRTIRFPENKRRFLSINEASQALTTLTRESTLIPLRTKDIIPIQVHSLLAQQNYYSAKRQLRKGRPDTAMELARQALAADSAWDDVWRLIGQIWIELDDTLWQAIPAIQHAIELDSTDVKTWQALAQYYITRYEWDDAERALKKAYSLKRNSPINLFLMSHLHRDRVASISGFTPTQTLERALAMHPGYFDARLMLARKLYEDGNCRKSRSLVVNGLKIFPESWELWELLSLLDVRGGKLQQALGEIQHSRDLAGEHPRVLYNMGLVYFYLDNLDTAKTYLNKSAQILGNSDTYYLLGQCAERQGDSTSAWFYYQKSVQSSSSSDDRSAQEAGKKIGLSIGQ